jgi:hypothetical protein
MSAPSPGEAGSIVSRDARPALETMLAAAGVMLDAPEVSVIWRVVVEFAHRPVSDVDANADGDLLLFEAGERDLLPGVLPDRSRGFVVSFNRQFSFADADGEYLGMERLRISIVIDIDGGSAGWPSGSIWGAARVADEPDAPAYEGIQPTVTRWVDAVESDPAFRFSQEGEPVVASLHYGPI